MNFKAAMNEITMKRDVSIEVNGVIQVLVNPPENFQPMKLNTTNSSMFNDCRAQSGGRQMGASHGTKLVSRGHFWFTRKPRKTKVLVGKSLERATRIELASSAWETDRAVLYEFTFSLIKSSIFDLLRYFPNRRALYGRFSHHSKMFLSH